MGAHKEYPVGSYQWQKRAASRHLHRTTKNGVKVPKFPDRPFVGVDGEGGNRVIDGVKRHQYQLLRAGKAELFNDDGSALSTVQCLRFISDLPPGVIYVGFFFDYDTAMIVDGMSVEKKDRLYHPNLRRRKNDPNSYWPVDYGVFQIDHRENKELKIRRRLSVEGAKPEYTDWVTIMDVGSFFQCTFVKALEDWFTEDEFVPVIERIAEGKNMRSEFQELTAHTRAYCRLEVQMLEKLMERFREVCNTVNLKPAKWEGPGYLVSSVMRREGFPRNQDIELYRTPIGGIVTDMANRAYYGGRFEAGGFGHFEGPIYQYDINSAYPAIYGQLPCLIHGKWHRFIGDDHDVLAGSGLYLTSCLFDHSDEAYYCGLPVRTKNGTIVFPRQGNGIYWGHEIQAALPHLRAFEAIMGVRYEKLCDCDPFSWVPAIYEERKRIGKGARGVPLKLVLNSTYGKLCQSIGSAPYANPIYASLITSLVRTQLYRACMASHNPALPGLGTLMLATDGIFTTDPRDLPIGTGLGEWELTVHDNMFIVQSGLYFLANKAPKTRGINRHRVVALESQFRHTWDKYYQEMEATGRESTDRCTVPVPGQSFVSHPLALARNKPETACQWVEEVRDVRFDWYSKRTTKIPNREGLLLSGRGLLTGPKNGHFKDTNHAYSKSIGGTSLAREVSRFQPDWNFGPL